MLRRIRAALSLSLIWGTVWTLGGAMLGFYRVHKGGLEFDWVRSLSDVLSWVLRFAVAWGAIGTTMSLVFCGLLVLLGTRMGRARLGARPVIGSGAFAGLLLAVGFAAFISVAEHEMAEPEAWAIMIIGGAVLGAISASAAMFAAGLHKAKQ